MNIGSLITVMIPKHQKYLANMHKVNVGESVQQGNNMTLSFTLSNAFILYNVCMRDENGGKEVNIGFLVSF